MGKLLGVASLIVSLVTFTPAVAAGIALNTGMTVLALILVGIGLVLVCG